MKTAKRTCHPSPATGHSVVVAIVTDALSDLSRALKLLGGRVNLEGLCAITRAEGRLLFVQDLLGGHGAHDSLRTAPQGPDRDPSRLCKVHPDSETSGDAG